MRVFGERGRDQTRELMDETDKREDVLGRVVVVQLSEEVPLRKGQRARTMKWNGIRTVARMPMFMALVAMVAGT